MSVTKQATKAINLKEDSVRYYKTDHSKILKRNDQKGPIVIQLGKREWANIQDVFGEAECGGSLPVGWILWRVYSVNIPGYYKPVLLKSRTQTRLIVIECMTNGYLRFFDNIVLYCKMYVKYLLLHNLMYILYTDPK